MWLQYRFPNSTMPIIGYAQVYIFENEYHKAEAEFKKLLQQKRTLTDQRKGFRNFAQLYAYMGKYREVEKMSDKVIEINMKLGDKTELASSYAAKALWLAVGGKDLEKARKTIGKGLELKNAGDLYFYGTLFYIYLLLEEYEKAGEVGKRTPIPFRDQIVRVYVHQARAEYEDAIKQLQFLSQPGPLYEKIFLGYNLAQCYIETGQNERAINTIQKMQQIFAPGYYYGLKFLVGLRAAVYSTTFYLLGTIYEKMGNRKQAIENYEKFLELWKHADEGLPELIDAKARLARLKGMSKK